MRVDSRKIERAEGLWGKMDLLNLAQIEEECLLKLRFSSKKTPRSLKDLNFSLG
jgi:hypothetical protein